MHHTCVPYLKARLIKYVLNYFNIKKTETIFQPVSVCATNSNKQSLEQCHRGVIQTHLSSFKNNVQQCNVLYLKVQNGVIDDY